MLLFYSDYCAHCRMLIETIKNYDKDYKIIKPVSIDVLRVKGKAIPSYIKSVPTLYIKSENSIKVGKEVFDYLLLPGSGILLKPLKRDINSSNSISDTDKTELISFAFTGNNFSDKYSLIDDPDSDIGNGFKENSYMWSNILDEDNTKINVEQNMLPIQEETRRQKSLLDIEQYRVQREMELKESDINKIELPIPKNTRE